MAKIFRGTGVAIVTPFHKYGVDFTSLGKILEHVINNGVDYIVALGTTSEVPTLSPQEKSAVTDFIIENVDKRIPIMLGMGGNNTQELVEKIHSTNFDGIDGILSVSPYYNKPQQKGIYYHFKAVADASPVPVMLYNVPGRTGSNMTAETTLQLAELSNVIGVKEASGNLMQCMEIINNKPKDFLVISGDDALTLPLIAVGAMGVISVTANAFPKEMSDMVNFALKGEMKKANHLHYKLLDVTNMLFNDGSPAGIKAALEIMGLCTNNLRLPLVKANKPTISALQNLITEFQSVKNS